MKNKTFKQLLDEGKGNFICNHCGNKSTRNWATMITKQCGM